MNLVRTALRSVWLRVAVTLALLAVVGRGIDWHLVGDRLLGGNLAWFGVAVAAVVCALVVGALRWRALLEVAGIHLSIRELGRVYAVSTFTQTFLPTTVGGDVARALLVARRGPMLARTASTIVVDRAGGLAGLLVVSWVAILVGTGATPHHSVAGLGWATVGTAAGALVLLWLLMRRPGLLMKIVPRRAFDALRDAALVARDVARSPRNMSVLLGYSAIFQALTAAQVWALARCIGDHPSFAAAAVTLTIVTFATLVPLSIGGFGIREGSYVVLLASVGINTTDATLISLGTVVVLLIASLPGALLLVTHGMRPALETNAQ